MGLSWLGREGYHGANLESQPFPRKIGKRFSVVVAAVSTAFPTNFAADDSGRYSL